MKALILAGGLGTRLRPLSCTRPKHLFPIANRPLLDLTLERLAKNGIREAILAVNFMADALERFFGKEKHGVKLHYSKDDLASETNGSQFNALGTGGSVKKAESLLREEECFLVLNGDILTTANYSEIIENHISQARLATIALYKVKDPSRFGVVQMTRKNQIERFVEKPTEKAPSNLVNAGIYIFKPAIFDYIPPNKKCSIERKIFPILAEKEELFGHEITNLWIDIGKPDDLIRANKLWLKAEVETSSRSTKARIHNRATTKDAVAIADDVTVGDESIVGPNVSLGKQVTVGKKVTIKDSIIFPRTIILDSTTIHGSIVGEHVRIGKNVKIGKGCLIGDHTQIHSQTSLVRNVKVCPSQKINGRKFEFECIT